MLIALLGLALALGAAWAFGDLRPAVRVISDPGDGAGNGG
jgi:hypothetical protein